MIEEYEWAVSIKPLMGFSQVVQMVFTPPVYHFLWVSLKKPSGLKNIYFRC